MSTLLILYRIWWGT